MSIGGPFGPWLMFYRAQGRSTGIMFSIDERNIALSGAIRGRGLVIAWTSSNNRFPFLDRSWEIGT